MLYSSASNNQDCIIISRSILDRNPTPSHSMDGGSSRNTLWFEDLERHRQPCLYYLSSEDDRGGPHLVCDWNGPPTDYKEFEFDLLRRRIDYSSHVPTKNDKSRPIQDEGDVSIDDEQPRSRVPPQGLLTEDDGARLDLLTVPPIVNSLMLRMFQEHNKNTKRPTISEEQIVSEKNVVKKAGRPKKDKDCSTTTQQQQSCKNYSRQ